MRKIWCSHSEKAFDGDALHNNVVEGPRRAGEGSIILFYLVAAGTFVLDRVSKILALQFLSESLPLIPNVFHLTLVKNQGIAFGLFAHMKWALLITVSVSLIFLTWMAHRPAFRNTRDQWVFGLILGGAFGNWFDRVQYGSVVDYFDFRIWPVFNIADSAISIGVGIYILYLFRSSSRKSKS